MAVASLDSLTVFAEVALFVSAALVLAVLGRLVAERVALPTAAVLLVAAAVFSDVFSGVGDVLSVQDVQWIASAALIVILFDGGLHIGRARFRRSAAEITVLGVVGTFATAGLVAVAAHVVLDFSWMTAGLLGAALAPTDPAVTFSVLGGKEVKGRSGTILEGESGFNDPVGIALMIGMVEMATNDGSFWIVVEEFLIEMGLGLAFGLVGGVALVWAMRRLQLPEALVPIWALGIVGVVFGVTAVLHGSGFLAVFIAGILAGDLTTRAWDATESFVRALANLAELAVFVALGLTISLGAITDGDLWWQGLVLAALLAFVARPLVVAPLLIPAQLTWGERGFVAWSGLKGAVPILLASLAVVGGTTDSDKVYGIVFVVVLFSVVVQGTGLPFVASRLGVPMEDARRSPTDRPDSSAAP
jgi:cell volume regulation protein A